MDDIKQKLRQFASSDDVLGASKFDKYGNLLGELRFSGQEVILSGDAATEQQIYERQFGEQRSRDYLGAIKNTLRDVVANRGFYLPKSSENPNWNGKISRSRVTGAFSLVTVLNAGVYDVHFVDDFFEAQDRPLVIARLNNDFGKPDNDFATNLLGLFIARDVADGLIGVGPLTKKMIANGEKYARVYYVHPAYLIALDEHEDERIRGRNKRLAIDGLVRHFPQKRKDYWRVVFEHIADGGTGSAEQQRIGINVSRVVEIVEGWFEIRGGSTTLEDYLANVGIESLETWKRYKRVYELAYPEKWRHFSELGMNKSGRPARNPPNQVG